jgi:hypothetical protein
MEIGPAACWQLDGKAPAKGVVRVVEGGVRTVVATNPLVLSVESNRVD